MLNDREGNCVSVNVISKRPGDADSDTVKFFYVKRDDPALEDDAVVHDGSLIKFTDFQQILIATDDADTAWGIVIGQQRETGLEINRIIEFDKCFR